jgi:hypothetical protein
MGLSRNNPEQVNDAVRQTMSELEKRILSILEEFEYENVSTMMNTVMQPAGDASELADMQRALKALVLADFISMCMELDASGRLKPLSQQESLDVIADLGSGLRYDSDRGLWTDTRHKGPPFGLAFPFMLATKDARAKGRDILVERGYQWWRPKK